MYYIIKKIKNPYFHKGKLIFKTEKIFFSDGFRLSIFYLFKRVNTYIIELVQIPQSIEGR